MTRKLLALFAVLALFLAACSSSDDDADDEPTTDESDETGDALSLDEWVAAVDQVCLDFQEDTDDVDAALDEAGNDTDAVAEALEDGIALFEDQLDEIEAVGTPDEDADLVDQALEVLQGQIDLLGELLAAVEDDDLDAVQEIGDELGDTEEEAQGLAEDLGLEECGSDDGSDDAEDAGPDDVDDGGSDDSGSGSDGSGSIDLDQARQDGITELTAAGFSEDQAECYVDYIVANADPALLELIVSGEDIDAAGPEALDQVDEMFALVEAAATECDIPPELLGF